MDKYTIRILALGALVCLHLVCSATVAQCQIMADTDSKKIDLPDGLCVEISPDGCTYHDGLCFHCLVTDVYYPTMDDCKSNCNKSSSLQDVLVAMTTSPPPPLSAP
ncbi:hypothetical protein CFC21_085694 [Triticum aestivum]|uniref:Embryo surrounding factor 1 brassicaceae domain-containing protein n=1 Tax=Triticum aestivum TaxID=4565 RepID=A0A9R1L8W4_WHEAT|nr:hypothetical protein CFC21_085694 [Triticum aestivum]